MPQVGELLLGSRDPEFRDAVHERALVVSTGCSRMQVAMNAMGIQSSPVFLEVAPETSRFQEVAQADLPSDAQGWGRMAYQLATSSKVLTERLK